MVDRIAREVFGLLFETSSEAVFVVDRASQRIVSANLRAGELLNRDVESLIGVSLGELVIEDRDLATPGHYEEVALRGGDGYPVHVELNVAHVRTADAGDLAAIAARDTSERRLLERELVAKHTALYTAHAELERAHAQLGDAKRELEARNQEIALLAWRAAMGELVSGIAHHLNNPVGALSSTLRRMAGSVAELPENLRGDLERTLGRVTELTRRIEGNVAAIVQASRSAARTAGAEHVAQPDGSGPALPPELAPALSAFAEKLEVIPTKDKS
ncbi:MAG TPA: PAS domain-containing protein [Kofleriaceae bacterium]|nr:PAS domain-containing protein [Kofleriaceae bacterium]